MKLKFSVFGFAALLITTAWTAPTSVETEKKVSSELTSTKPVEGNFSFVRVHRQGKGITATWGLQGDQSIVGFQVKKTYEDPNDEYAVWEEICSVPYTGARSYRFTDNNVFPGSIHYCVLAIRSDGSTLSSGIVSARIISR